MSYLKFAFFTILASYIIASCTEGENFNEELAFRWAPVHYQCTYYIPDFGGFIPQSDTQNQIADYITRFDYDNTISTGDNWEHLETGNLSAYVYYSICETTTHWFIIYAFYHPRDWDKGLFFGPHENDMEGVLLTIKKTTSKFGELQTMITTVHSDFYSYTMPNSTIQGNHEQDIDGHISLFYNQGFAHPWTAQDCKGHACYAYPYVEDFTDTTSQDGIVYFPSKSSSETPTSGRDHSVNYKLKSLYEFGGLWMLQMSQSLSHQPTELYATWGSLVGTSPGENNAGAPWRWDDHDDYFTHAGEFALDPAHLVNYYFKGLGDFDLKYIDNKYLSDLKANEFNDANRPMGFPSALTFTNLFSKIEE